MYLSWLTLLPLLQQSQQKGIIANFFKSTDTDAELSTILRILLSIICLLLAFCITVLLHISSDQKKFFFANLVFLFDTFLIFKERQNKYKLFVLLFVGSYLMLTRIIFNLFSIFSKKASKEDPANKILIVEVSSLFSSFILIFLNSKPFYLFSFVLSLLCELVAFIVFKIKKPSNRTNTRENNAIHLPGDQKVVMEARCRQGIEN